MLPVALGGVGGDDDDRRPRGVEHALAPQERDLLCAQGGPPGEHQPRPHPGAGTGERGLQVVLADGPGHAAADRG